jgi:hypothetical protein
MKDKTSSFAEIAENIVDSFLEEDVFSVSFNCQVYKAILKALESAYNQGLDTGRAERGFKIGKYKITQNTHGVWFSIVEGERNGESMQVTERCMDEIWEKVF